MKGPAGEFVAQSEKDVDIIDEALNYFRANILFSQFEVEGGADLTLVYLTAWIADCLRKLQKEKTKVKILSLMRFCVFIFMYNNTYQYLSCQYLYRKQQRKHHIKLE